MLSHDGWSGDTATGRQRVTSQGWKIIAALGPNRQLLKDVDISDRYFEFTPSQAQDSEAKFIEFAMEKARGTTTPPSKLRSELVTDIFTNSNMQLDIITEMSPCESCSSIIKEFGIKGNLLGSKVSYKFGVRYPL